METLDRLREAEHTGENRCWPCTVVNAAIVAVFSLWLLVRKRRVASLAVSTVGAALIYLRGYVVPYTPLFAPELVAASPLPEELFHGERYDPAPDERESLTDTDRDGQAVLSDLTSAGVIETDGEMLHLTEKVETEWYEEMDRLAARSTDALADEIERSVPRIAETDTLDVDGQDWVSVGDNDAFLSRQVAIAELAAYNVLRSYFDDEDVRLAGSQSLLMFLEECPVCKTPIVESTEANCCGAYADPGVPPSDILVCPECEQRVFTFPNA